MKTITLCALLAAAPTLAVAGPKDEAPLGVGFGSTVGGTTGIILEKHFSEQTGAQLGVGVSLGTDTVATGAGVYGVYRFVGDDRGSGNFVYGADVRVLSVGGSASVDFGPSVGVQGDVFVTPGLSVWAQTGVSFLILGKNTVGGGIGGAAVSGSGVAMRIGPSHPFATVGFTWWVGQ